MEDEAQNTSVFGVIAAIVLVILIAVVGYFIWNGLKSDTGETESDTVTDIEDEEDSKNEKTEDTNENVTEDEDEGEAEESTDNTEDETQIEDFANFSSDTQTLGSSTDKASAKYTLASITDTQQAGFHRFVFQLESTQTDFAKVEVQLVSSGGYIRVLLDRVTEDTSGLIYQGTRDINKEGVLKLYHAVTPNESEEVYQIGISSDTPFYLHSESGLKVVLDVKYPGAPTDTGSAEDPMVFTTSETTLTGTNTASDVRLTNYSWSTESSVVKFIWGTSSASGNPTPPTNVKYNALAKTVTVNFTGILSDAVIGSDGTFSTDLSTVIDEVTGSRSGTTSTFAFHLNKESRYRIYRSSSPNQVVLDIER